MKTGRTLTDLAAELERQAETKKDYLADSRALSLDRAGDGEVRMVMKNGHAQDFGIGAIAHQQIAAKTEIPRNYYDRMLREAPQLLTRNVNHWFQEQPTKHLVRTLDGRARAFLSSKYRPLDNYDLAEIVLPKLHEMGCRIESCELTESRLYIKAVTERIQAEVKKGDVVQAGLVIGNSEVGLGRIFVDPLLLRLVCLNGAIMNDYGMKRHHVGKSGDFAGIEGAAEFFRDETRLADDRAFWMKVRDTVGAALSQVTFNKIVNRWQESTEQKITGSIEKVVEVAAVKFGLFESERSGVLRHLIEGGDLSAYGLMNAITRTSQDVESYDRATELETIGPKVLELPRQNWKEIAEAA